MARVPAAEVERLEREVSVRRLAEARGVSFERSGAGRWLGRCCFHDAETASLVVTDDKNLWQCVGACNASGGPIEFVMRAEGVTFRHAVELLRAGVDLEGPVGPKRATIPKLPCPLDAAATDAQLLAQVRDYYHQQLKSAPEALAYLDSRGLKDDALISHFRLGFANRTLGLRLPDANRDAGAKLRGRLQRLGVWRDSGHEHLNGSLIVPIHDEAGGVAGMYGRKVTANLRAGTPQHLYLPGPHTAAFNSAALAEGNGSAIICEAIFDALSFWGAGFRNVTAAYGVEGITAVHLDALKRHRVRHVFLAFDRDDAGDAAAVAVAGRLAGEGFDCYRAQFPLGLDANEYASKAAPGSKALGGVLRHAAYMGTGVPRGTPDLSCTTASAAKRVAPRPPPEARPTPAPTVPESRPIATAPVPTAPPEAAPEPPPKVGAPGSVMALPATQSPGPAPSPTITELALPPPAPGMAAPSTAAPGLTDDEAVITFGPRRYRVRGLLRPHTPDALRLNTLLSHGEAFHVDTFDLYSAKARASFVQSAAAECQLEAETVKRDLGQVLLHVETLLDRRREDARGPRVPSLTEEERDAALDLLRAPELLSRILEDFGRCGVVGEETNKLVGYLAAISRKLDEPLAVLIQSSSAAGKSSLMEAVLAFVPEEEKAKFSAVTGQALYYMGEVSLRHKVLAVVEEEGASRAAYALKLLQSEGELTIASTGKDPQSGRLVTHEYHVEGPTQLFLTTTATDIDEELLNRCLVLTVDEDRAQTFAIHEKQRHQRTLEGRLERKEKEATLAMHQNAQRLLRPLAVVNPFARQLTFPDAATRARRDFPKYLTLIDAIALLHQYQRPVKTARWRGGLVEYVEVTPDDITTANRLAASVLRRSQDELPPQTRRLLGQLEAYVGQRASEAGVLRAEVRFTRREVREALKWGDTQLKVHLGRLTDLELVAPLRTAHGGYLYSLRHTEAAVPGLLGLALPTPAPMPDVWSGPADASRGPVGPSAAPPPPAAAAADPSLPCTLAASSPSVGLDASAQSPSTQSTVVATQGDGS